MTTARDERKTKTNVYGLISDLLLEIEKREHKIFSRMIQIWTKVWGENLLSSVV